MKVLEHLEAYNSSLAVGERLLGKTVVVVNRSEVVGRPLAAMLANDGATVYSVDIDSIFVFKRGKLEVPDKPETIESLAPRADILILGVPSASYKLDVGLVKEGAIVLNVASHKNIDETALLSTVKNVRYVGQVGKVTVAMLERNLLRLHANFAGKECCNWPSDLAGAALAVDAPDVQKAVAGM